MQTHTHHNPPSVAGTMLWLTIGLAIWLFAVLITATNGALAALGQAFMPGYAILVALGIALPSVLFFVSPRYRDLITLIGLRNLTLLHIWRIPAALLFFYYGLQGQLPPMFWILAGVGDLLAGLYAATLLFRPATTERIRNIHYFGFADFVVAVATGLTLTLLGDPRMALLTTLPMALIPLFGVGISGATHIYALRLLKTEAATERA